MQSWRYVLLELFSMGHYETVGRYHTILFECYADSTYTMYYLPYMEMTPLRQQLPVICVSLKAPAQMFVVKMICLLTSTLWSGSSESRI